MESILHQASRIVMHLVTEVPFWPFEWLFYGGKYIWFYICWWYIDVNGFLIYVQSSVGSYLSLLIHFRSHQAPKQRLTFEIHSLLDTAASPLRNFKNLGKSGFYATLSDCQTTFDSNNVRKFRKACLQRLVREETNNYRCVELDIILVSVTIFRLKAAKFCVDMFVFKYQSI